MRITGPAVVALVSAAVLAGCGGGDGASTRNFNAAGDARYTPDQVAKIAGLKSTDGDISWTGPGGCQVSVIMTSAGEVQTYAGAGDAVVTNPRGDVGVKFFPDPGCRQKLLAALARVK